MSAYEYAFTLTPGRSSRVRSLTIACTAIAAVCVLSSAVVMRELIGGQPARAAAAPTVTPAATAPTGMTVRTWALEPRWWQGEIRQIVRPAAAATTVPDSELTFTKGYQLRLAARHAGQPAQPTSQPAQVATTVPSTDTKLSRPAATARKATTIAHTETPEIHRVSATRIDGPGDPFARFDVGTRALAYDEQRPRERGIAETRRAPSRGLFGTLY
jgi:hypothetical protein